MFVGHGIRFVVLQRKIEVENGNIGGAGFDNAGAAEVARKVVHRGVDFLVYFDKGEVGMGAVVEL